MSYELMDLLTDIILTMNQSRDINQDHIEHLLKKLGSLRLDIVESE